MTVSNAFSRPDQLSAALRERILRAADELGYAGPDPAARSLARGRSGTIGVLFTDSLSYAFTDRVSTEFLGAVAAQFEPLGIAMTLMSDPRGGAAVRLGNVAMDAAIVYSLDADSPSLPWIRRRGVPLVYVDQVPEAGLVSVNVDDRGGAVAVAEHVVALGHRCVGIVTEGLVAPYDEVVDPSVGSRHHVINERLLGWLDPIRAAGGAACVFNLYRNTVGDGYRAAGRLLDRTPRPTALLCMSDALAVGALRAAAERGLDVPRALSVVGFDDGPLATSVQPALTTVRQPVQRKGELAARAVLHAAGALPDDVAPPPQHVLLPTELVVRASTGPAPA